MLLPYIPLKMFLTNTNFFAKISQLELHFNKDRGEFLKRTQNFNAYVAKQDKIVHDLKEELQKRGWVEKVEKVDEYKVKPERLLLGPCIKFLLQWDGVRKQSQGRKVGGSLESSLQEGNWEGRDV
jgi:hypothetical protein